MNKWSNYGKWRHPELYKKYSQKMKKTYTNRQLNKFTFEVNERGNIQWSGDFKFHRYGIPNDYSKAYKKYFEENCDPPHDHTLSLEQFKIAINNRNHPVRKYYGLVQPKEGIVDMVDPSGGPYIFEGMNMKVFGFEGMIVDHFIKNEQGYEIVIKK